MVLKQQFHLFVINIIRDDEFIRQIHYKTNKLSILPLVNGAEVKLFEVARQPSELNLDSTHFYKVHDAERKFVY